MRRLLLQLLHAVAVWYNRAERRALLLLGAVFALSFAVLLVVFYREETMLVPASGGTYIEGSTGALQPLNPWFTVQNDVNRDIVSLVFSGLLKYNPDTRRIEEDLATMQVSGDKRAYTLRLRDGLQWHDSTGEAPHPVTADDVLFTFQTVQDPAFPNGLLRQNFRGVSVKKLDDRTVQFVLETPYYFFPSNLTLGLLPKRAFEGVPVARLDQTLDFGFSNPVGAGPYKVRSIVQTDLSTEVTLERFPRGYGPVFRLERLIFRIFPDYGALLSDLRNVQGIRLAAKNDRGAPAIPANMTARSYTLPQYVALFLNMDRAILSDGQLRLGLQLGTDKQTIVEAVGESVIVDTPLLELPGTDWRNRYDASAAQGALFESEWYFPEKLRLQRILEQRDANAVGPLRLPPVALLDTGASLTVTGSLVNVSTGALLNGIRLVPSATGTGTWTASLPTVAASGALNIGTNLLRLTDAKGKVLDSAYITRVTDVREYRRATEEQRMLQEFLASKTDTEQGAQTAQDFRLEEGYLRRRQPTDGVDVRINDRGQRLRLTLLTSPSPPQYAGIAELVAEQWRSLGVEVAVDVPPERASFEEKLLRREYDVLLFGQSLLDNLDSYPYWHSSGVQKVTESRSDLRLDAYNLSQYSSLDADALLETIRRTSDDRERLSALRRLNDILRKDVPAIPLYSPTYTFAHDAEFLGIELGALSLHSDRFLTLDHWYVKQERVFRPGSGWLGFIPWLFSFLSGDGETPPAGSGALLQTGSGSGGH